MVGSINFDIRSLFLTEPGTRRQISAAHRLSSACDFVLPFNSGSRRGRANVRYEVVARPPRPRRTRREQERELRKVVRRTEGLAGKLPGGAPERPIDVASASVIDEKARATPCVQCGGDLELLGDRATSTARGVVREIALVCRRCHAPRTQWFRIVPPSPN